MTKLEERLNQLAEKIVIKLDEKGREYDVCDFGLPIADDCEMKKMITTVRDEIKSLILELPELKAFLEAGDNMREELSNFWGGSSGEDQWLTAVSQWRSFVGEVDNEQSK